MKVWSRIFHHLAVLQLFLDKKQTKMYKVFYFFFQAMIINTTPCGEDILTNHLAEHCVFFTSFFPWVGLFLPPKQKSVADVSWN